MPQIKFKKEFDMLKKFFIPYKKRFYLGTILSLLATAIGSMVPYIYGKITDLAIYKSAEYYLMAQFLLVWLLLTLLGDYLRRLSSKIISLASIKISADIYYDISRLLINLPMHFHKEKKTGKIFRRVIRGTDEVGHLAEAALRNILPQSISLIIALAIVFVVRWELAMLLLLIIVLYVAVTIWRVRPIIKNQEKMWSHWERADHVLMDALSNIHTVKSTASESYEDSRRKRALGRAHNYYYTWVDLWRTLDAWQQTIFTVGFVLLFGCGIFLLSREQITPGELIMFVGYITLISGPLFQLGFLYRQIVTSMVVVERMLDIYKQKPEKEFINSSDIEINGEVEFLNVHFGYKGGNEVLRGISFKINAGQTVALVGRSGVGKTTAMDLLSRYYLPQEGDILIDGHSIKKFTLKSLREQISILPQEVVLFHETIMENIRYSRKDATDKEVIQSAKLANAHDFIEKFPKKYESVVGERGVKLSVGQKDRVGIARAILRNPRILILDEPTSNLDAHSEHEVQEALQDLMRGRTTFIIAHRLSTIKNADKILVFDEGKILEEGTHYELMAKDGFYKKLFNVQFGLD